MIIPSCNISKMGTTGGEKKSILHTKFEGVFWEGRGREGDDCVHCHSLPYRKIGKPTPRASLKHK